MASTPKRKRSARDIGRHKGLLGNEYAVLMQCSHEEDEDVPIARKYPQAHSKTSRGRSSDGSKPRVQGYRAGEAGGPRQGSVHPGPEGDVIQRIEHRHEDRAQDSTTQPMGRAQDAQNESIAPTVAPRVVTPSIHLQHEAEGLLWPEDADELFRTPPCSPRGANMEPTQTTDRERTDGDACQADPVRAQSPESPLEIQRSTKGQRYRGFGGVHRHGQPRKGIEEQRQGGGEAERDPLLGVHHEWVSGLYPTEEVWTPKEEHPAVTAHIEHRLHTKLKPGDSIQT